MDTVRLVLEQHRFEPAEATVKAGERFRIEVTNRDPTPSEIESSDMRIEKIVPAGAKVTLTAGPLSPGDTGSSTNITLKPQRERSSPRSSKTGKHAHNGERQ